jgi:hypoxanthine phosphoribosyltransferase
MCKDLERVLLSEAEIAARIGELGADISKDFSGKNLLMVSVLKGSVVFMSDLMRALTIPAAIDFMAVSSYGKGDKTTGIVSEGFGQAP